MTAKRIYVVRHSDRTSLVRAESRNAAIRYIADRDIKAELATQDDCFKLAGENVKIEEAS